MKRSGFGDALRLRDMHGNVSEWVEDCHAEIYAAAQPSNEAACPGRVSPVGYWFGNPQFLCSTIRSGPSSAFRAMVLGFRLARTLWLRRGTICGARLRALVVLSGLLTRRAGRECPLLRWSRRSGAFDTCRSP